MELKSKVTAIADKRRNSGDEITQAEYFRLVAQKMNGAGPANWPAFPRRFLVVADEAGRKSILEQLDGEIVRHVDPSVVADAAYGYCWTHLPHEPKTSKLDSEKVDKLRNVWLRCACPIAMPPPVREKSEPGLTFMRLEFDAPAGRDGPTPPLFEALLSRCTQPMALCAFIGSLFYPEADRQQYLYLHGDGGDGKGALMRLLFELFGRAAAALEPPTRGDRFWNMNLFVKRLAIFFDCADWGWFGSPRFKSLTGNDPLMFEAKGRSGFTARPTFKIIAASNTKPDVSSQRADMRRLIFIEVKPFSGPEDPQYEAKLRAEAAAIVRQCKAIYQEQCPGHGPIPVEHAKDVALEAESEYLNIFYGNFTPVAGCNVSGEAVRSVLQKAGIASCQAIRKVKEAWLRQVPGLTIKHTARGTRYEGIKRIYTHE